MRLEVPDQVVVGIDAGGRADNAVRAALAFKKRFETRVDLIHAVGIPTPEEIGGDPVFSATVNAEILTKTWKAIGDRLASIYEGAGFLASEARDHLQVVPGKAARTLIEHARDVNADIIMMGPHQSRGLLDFGRTARAVIAEARCDLWVQPESFEPIRRILVPTDLSDESLKALETARKLARRMEAGVTVLHCFVPPEFAYASVHGYPDVASAYVVADEREKVRQQFEETVQAIDWEGVEWNMRFTEARPAEAILEAQGEFDLIAMGTHGRTGLSAAVLGNVAYSVLKQANKPVLALRHMERPWLL